MKIIQISKSSPFIWRFDEGVKPNEKDYLLIFECIPEQYRKVYNDWLSGDNNDDDEEEEGGGGEKPRFFRLKIPCSVSEDAFDLDDFLQQYKPKSLIYRYKNKLEYNEEDEENEQKEDEEQEEFTGTFNAHAFDHSYEVVEITDFKKIYRNGFECEKHLLTPDFTTGLTYVQQQLLSLTHIQTAEIRIQAVSNDLMMSRSIVKQQFDFMRFCNLPMVKVLSRDYVEVEPILSFPYYAINGPFPYSPVEVFEYCKNVVDRVTSKMNGIGLKYPHCPPYKFKQVDGKFYGVPYKLPIDDDIPPKYIPAYRYRPEKKYIQSELYDGTFIAAKGEEDKNEELFKKYEIRPNWTFIREGKYVTFQGGIKEYLNNWIEDVTSAVAHVVRERKLYGYKKDLLRTIWAKAVFDAEPKPNEIRISYKKRVWMDEDDNEKRARIKKEFGGFYKELENLPIFDLKPSVMSDDPNEDDHGLNRLGWSPSDDWMFKLEKFIQKYPDIFQGCTIHHV